MNLCEYMLAAIQSENKKGKIVKLCSNNINQ